MFSEQIEDEQDFKVLLINDEFFILNILTQMMKKEGMKEVDTACNGFEGYNKAINKYYDFVICDINMPVMDGYQFCENFIKNFNDQNKFFDSK